VIAFVITRYILYLKKLKEVKICTEDMVLGDLAEVLGVSRRECAAGI